MNLKSYHSSVLPFLPLMVLYIAVVLVFSSAGLEGDEDRHLRYATNLAHGYYTDADNPELLNGPGYPIVLTPFVALNSKLLLLKFLNALFVIVGVVYFYKSVELFAKKKHAIFFAYLIGLYPPLIRYMPLLYSESLAFMVICGIIYHFCKLSQSERVNRKQLIITSLYLGWLILVKIIFLHVIGLSMLLIAGLFIVKKNKQVLRISLIVFLGVIFITPYLIYAHALTGKLLYLGTGGGEILYHRSSPYENELGNWFSEEDALNGQSIDYEPSQVYENLHQLSKNHRDFYLELEPLTNIERDSAFKSMAIKNMKAHPGKYLKNTIANTGRFFFHYPFSYRNQNMGTYGYMIPNMFILVLWALSLFPVFMSKKKIPFELKAIMVFILIYACGTILADGRGRNFIIMVPFLVLFVAYVYTNILKITLVKTEEVKVDI